MAMASLFKSWKLASYTNQGFFFPSEEPVVE